MNVTNTLVLLANNLIKVEPIAKKHKANPQMLGTVVSNLMYYGFIPSKEAYASLNKMNDSELSQFWTDLAPAIKELTGANRQMDKFVVYKNFPKEVLEMSKAEYWCNQILMYWGAPNVLFTQEEKARPELLEKRKLKVLALAKKNSIASIYSSLLKNPARWTDNQNDFARFLLTQDKKTVLDLDSIGFKENGLVLIGDIIVNKLTNKFYVHTATDVLRLAAVLSGSDVALRECVRFKNFKRYERKLLLSLLDKCKNITEDFGTRAEVWKRLLHLLHPGDYNFKRVKTAYNALYNKNIMTFNKIVDGYVSTPDEVLAALKSRPGEFLRRLHSTYNKYGIDAVNDFVSVTPKLSTLQLVRLRKYIETINNRKTLMYPPKGNWAKVQSVLNKKKPFSKQAVQMLNKVIDKELSKRMRVVFPNGVKLDTRTKAIKLQTNDQKLADYGRGTTFDIPENVKFIRSASYWAHDNTKNTWFDNGWNFFDGNWKEKGVCSWNSTYYTGTNQYRYNYWSDGHKIQKDAAAVFSGDPTNSKDLKGRACQMLDLYVDKLLAAGVRYAVWNILCFSKVPFDQAEDVLATLQMGEKPETGNLYEPSRAQMVFPLKSKHYTSYVAYLDLVKRKIVYMDAPLKADVYSASYNGQMLAEKMPQYVEYLNSLPSVYDLVSKAKKGTTPILFSDEKKFKAKKAYVFRPSNASNQFDNIKLTDIVK